MASIVNYYRSFYTNKGAFRSKTFHAFVKIKEYMR